MIDRILKNWKTTVLYPGVYGKIYPDGSFCIYLRRFFRSLQ